LTPRIESVIAEKNGKVHLAKVDIDELTDLALEYDVIQINQNHDLELSYYSKFFTIGFESYLAFVHRTCIYISLEKDE